jgi:hypothetical protein
MYIMQQMFIYSEYQFNKWFIFIYLHREGGMGKSLPTTNHMKSGVDFVDFDSNYSYN